MVYPIHIKIADSVEATHVRVCVVRRFCRAERRKGISKAQRSGAEFLLSATARAANSGTSRARLAAQAASEEKRSLGASIDELLCYCIEKGINIINKQCNERRN